MAPVHRFNNLFSCLARACAAAVVVVIYDFAPSIRFRAFSRRKRECEPPVSRWSPLPMDTRNPRAEKSPVRCRPLGRNWIPHGGRVGR
ncbi:hypothetical protein EVAR_95770_1 [Eumeta japonica]|uniref:Uncharacterized protein n=1 Tax=Eumeta variegata TaxID=151549 RepID=A0A4C1UM91_EUMVA|nr:hypothetical protein EVAR_95770_1 [Eumeta japonica]